MHSYQKAKATYFPTVALWFKINHSLMQRLNWFKYEPYFPCGDLDHKLRNEKRKRAK